MNIEAIQPKKAGARQSLKLVATRSPRSSAAAPRTVMGPVAVIIGGYLLGIYFQNRSIAHLDKPIDDVGKRIDDVLRRIDDTRDLLRAEMRTLKAEIVAEIERQANRKVV